MKGYSTCHHIKRLFHKNIFNYFLNTADLPAVCTQRTTVMPMVNRFFMALPLLAQSGGLDSALNQTGTILYKIAFLVGTVCVMAGGWSIRKGDADSGKMAIIGGAIIALAGLIMEALFQAAGMSSAAIHFSAILSGINSCS